MRLLAGDESKLLSLGILRWLGFHVWIAFNLCEACRSQIVEEVPICKEPEAFAIPKDMPAIMSLNHICLPNPGCAVDAIEVLEAADA